MRRLALVLMLGLLAAGCRTTRAAMPVERPALAVPPAPPRVVEMVVVSEPANPEPVPDLPPPAARPAAKPRASSPREVPGKDAQKPEVKPEATVADAVPAAPPVNPAPTPVLRTPATVDTAAAERQIRETLDRATKGLENVDYGRLSDLRQKAYNETKEFIKLAEAAMRTSNFELGRELAEKAEKYALALQGR